MFQSGFPYVNPPLAGSPNDLSLTITLQKSSAVTGPYVDTPATYDTSSSTLSTPKSSDRGSFYRAKADQKGVRLGSPVANGSSVVLGLQTP
jgi:hypothetical protein